MINKIAWFFSIILHPLILLNFGIFIILYFHPYYTSRYYEDQLFSFVLYLSINTIVIPTLAILLLKQFKFVDNFQISNHKQRTIPYAFIAVLLSITVYQLIKNDMRGLPIYFMIGCVLSLIVNLHINLKFSISSHTIAAGGFIALVSYMVFVQNISALVYWLPISIIIAGLSGFSRLWLNAHTTKQAYFGYLVGFIVVFTTIYTSIKFAIFN